MNLPKLSIFRRSSLNQHSSISSQSLSRDHAEQNERIVTENENKTIDCITAKDGGKMSKVSARYLLILSVLIMSQISSAANESGQVNNNSKKMCSADNLTPKSTATTLQASNKTQDQSQVIESLPIPMPDTNKQQPSVVGFPRQKRRLARSNNEQTATTDYPPTSMEAKVSTATTQFGLNFLNNILQDGKENVVISPLSIQTLLNMILLGSDDNSSTQRELSKILGYETTGLLSESSADRLKPHEALKSVLEIISQNTNRVGENPSPNKVNFNLANLVLTDKDVIDLKQDYEKELKKYYSVNIDYFSGGAKDAANKKVEPIEERINKWVRNNTQNQIQKLVNEGELSGGELLMVLLNAANFKGNWLHQFKESHTQNKTFFNNGKNEKKVKFMSLKEKFGYANFALNSPFNYDLLRQDDKTMSKEEQQKYEMSKKLDCAVLSMPFSPNNGQELSMVILLPDKKDGIDQLQKSLDAQTLNEIFKSLTKGDVWVNIPKFSFEASHDAKSILMKMGLKDIFGSPKFDRMLISKTGRKAQVDSIIHKAKISVDETGAEAAAATLAKFIPLSLTLYPEFIADHPFLFIIRHSRTNMPLFMGRVNHL